MSLPACSYLAEVLEYLLQGEEEEEGEGWRARVKRWEERNRLVLGVQQFHWDDSYYFHNSEQMEMVGRLCPGVRELHFMYENRSVVG